MELEANLRKLTGQQVIIDSMDNQGAVWHSETINSLPGCPEREIRELLAIIKGPDNFYTRDFKMFMTEYFEPPAMVTIDWLGPCENLGRKRSQVDVSELVSSTRAPFSDESLIPTQPTTTTEAPLSTPDPEISTTEVTTSSTEIISATSVQPELENVTDLFGSSFDELFKDLGNVATTTLSTDAPINVTDFQSSISTSTSTAVITDDIGFTGTPPFGSSTTEHESTTERIKTTSADTTETSTSEGTDATTILADMVTESTVARKEPVEAVIRASEPHYGKYVGLSAAFLIFVAYLVCSRAYRRQGMYELHSE